MIALLHGLLVGLLLSSLRAPLGYSLVELVAVRGETTARLRAGALFAIAAMVLPGRPLFRHGLALGIWLTGILLGIILHGAVILPRFEPAGRVGFGLLLFAALPLLWILSGRGASGAKSDPEMDPDGTDSPRLGITIGTFLAGAGAALTLDAVARHARLFTLGLPEDDSLTGSVLAVLVLVGYLAFGRPHARRNRSEPERGTAALAVGAALSGPAALVGLRFLQGLELAPYFRYLKRFGLDFTLVGTARAEALTLAAALIAPAFALGLMTGGLASARRLRAALFGAAFGVLATPLAVRSLGSPMDYLAARADPFAWRLVVLGGGLGILGALLSLPSVPGGRRRAVAALAVLAGASALALGPRPAVWQVSPWLRQTVEPELLLHTPAGLVTVEPEYATLPTRILTLDRRRMTPLSEEESIDRERIGWCWSMIPPDRRASGSARILFVGQMTPARAEVFRQLPPHVLERTAPWAEAMEVIEEHLFADEELGPVGEIVAADVAESRFRSGAYDLVVVPPISGPVLYPKSAQWIHWGAVGAPTLAGLDTPEGTLAVVWVDANSTLSQRVLPGPVIPAVADGLQQISFGVVLGGFSAGPGDLSTGMPIRLPSGAPSGRPTPWDLLGERAEFRNYTLARTVTARFGAAAARQPMLGVARALALHAEPQVHSSPYDSRAEQIELSEDALKALVDAAREAEPDPATRRIWEAFAWLLFERREIGMTLTYLEPVAEAYPPWPVLERVVARAYQEFDLPEEASKWLDRVLEAAPLDIQLLAEGAEWKARAGDLEGACQLLERAQGLQPGRLELRRHLGMLWVRAGDPRGRELLTELLIDHPEDTEIAQYLGTGPLPPLPQGFLPSAGLHAEEPEIHRGAPSGHPRHFFPPGGRVPSVEVTSVPTRPQGPPAALASGIPRDSPPKPAPKGSLVVHLKTYKTSGKPRFGPIGGTSSGVGPD